MVSHAKMVLETLAEEYKSTGVEVSTTEATTYLGVNQQLTVHANKQSGVLFAHYQQEGGEFLPLSDEAPERKAIVDAIKGYDCVVKVTKPEYAKRWDGRRRIADPAVDLALMEQSIRAAVEAVLALDS